MNKFQNCTINGNWLISLSFLYAFEENTPKDEEIIKYIQILENIINNKLITLNFNI